VSTPPISTDEQIERGLAIAKNMATVGIPIFIAVPDPRGLTKSGKATGFALPDKWEKTRPNKHLVDYWRPGDALCAVGGHLCDFMDTDPRNGGDQALEYLRTNGMLPCSYGTASTPSGGTHHVIAPLRLRKGKRNGIDYQGGDADGNGRGFVFIAPTVRPSKITGEMRMYQWDAHPDLGQLLTTALSDTSGEKFAQWVSEKEQKPHAKGGTGSAGSVAADHIGVIRPGTGHDKMTAFCGYLLKKYPEISFDEYLRRCEARWRDFDQSSFTWTWDECRANPVEDCWDRFERGAPFSVWVKTRKRKRTPFAGVIGSATATPFTGKRERGTA
jgi:hypothetical protein